MINWLTMARQCLDDAALVTTVFVGFLAVGMLYTFINITFGSTIASALIVLVSLGIAAMLITIWALWIKFVDWAFDRIGHRSVVSHNPEQPGEALLTLQVLLGSRLLPSMLVATAVIVGFIFIPSNSTDYGVDLRNVFIIFYLVVICIAPFWRSLVARLLPKPSSNEDSAVTAVFE